MAFLVNSEAQGVSGKNEPSTQTPRIRLQHAVRNVVAQQLNRNGGIGTLLFVEGNITPFCCI